MRKVIFRIEGDPVGKGRPRFMRNGHTYTPDKTTEYERRVALAYRQAVHGFKFPKGSPIEANVEVVYSIPTSASKKKRAAMQRGDILPLKKPDADNIQKIIFDALNGVAYDDDAQIYCSYICKRYAKENEAAHVGVVLYGADFEDERWWLE